MTREEKAKRNELIKQDRLNGFSMRECSEKYGLKNIAYICKQMGVDGRLSQNKSDYIKVSEKLKGPKVTGAEYLKKYGETGFACTGLFEGCEGKIGLRCVKCGYEFEYSAQGIRRRRKIKCKKCSELEQEAKALEIKKEQNIRKEERMALAEQKKKEKTTIREGKKRTIDCEMCGKSFITYRANAKTCSKECSRKRSNKISSRAKDSRINNLNNIDKDITLESLFKRDAGVCYICGGRCNWEDYTMRGSTFIAGDWYPSIEHVTPLSHGGLNAWSNVRLAHRRCNYLKRDNLKINSYGQISLF